ncbi:MAG TPA: hypothetical protein VFW45_08375 [Candidatus Polarisedimenticolia bacterium]|nr:hypothetical protein [Candidatus Polarisedimenticolia bacterium]
MRGRSTDLRTFGVVAMVLMLLAISFGTFAYIYISRQRTYLITRNFRLLGAQSDRLTLMIENYANDVLGNMVSKSWDASKSKSGSTCNKEMFSKNLKEQLELAPALKLVGAPSLEPRHKQEPGVVLAPIQEGGQFRLEFQFTGAAGDRCVASFRVATALDELLGTINDQPFDDLLIVDNDTKVIYRRANSGPRLTQIGVVTNESGEEVPYSKVLASTDVYLLNLGGAPYRLFVQPVRVSLSKGRPEAPSSESVVNWSLCGLVRKDRFRAESTSLSYTLLIVILFLFITITASWPLVKLWSLQATDRLGIRDGIFISASVLLLTGLAVFFVLDMWSYVQLRGKLDLQLQRFAEEMDKHFHLELTQLTAMLNRFDRSSSDFKEQEQERILAHPPAWLDIERGAPYFEVLTLVHPGARASAAGGADKRAGKQFAKWTTERRTRANIDVSERDYFRTIDEERGWPMAGEDKPFFLDTVLSANTGRSLSVLSRPGPCRGGCVETLIPHLVSLRDVVAPPGFGYAILDEQGRLLFHSDSKRVLVEDFFAECDQSRALRARVSARAADWVDVSYTGRGHRLYVTPMKDVPWTLVTFRDKEIECTANLELLSASIILYLLYACLLLLPALILCFSGPEWMWHDARRAPAERQLLAANLVLILICASRLFTTVHHHIPLMAFALPPFALLLNCVRLKAETDSAWRRAPYFAALTALPMVLLALGILERLQAHREPQRDGILAVTILQGVVMGACVPLVAFPRRLIRWPRIGSLRGSFPWPSSLTTYVLLAVSLVVLLSVVPAIGCFRATHDTEMEVLVKHGQLGLARAIAERRERVNQYYRDIPATPSFVAHRLQDNTDLYYGFFFNTTVLPPRNDTPRCTSSKHRFEEASRGHLFDEVLEVIRPLYNEFSVQTHNLLHDSSDDCTRQWIVGPGHVSLVKGPGGAGDHLPLGSEVPLLSLPTTAPGWLGVLLGFALLPVLLYLLVRSVLRKLFCIDLSLPSARPAENRVLGEVQVNTLVLGPPLSGKSRLIAGPEFQRIDIRQVEAAGKWDETLAQLAPQSGKVVAIDHFETLQDDPARNRWKMRLLEQLLLMKCRIVVCSAADPMSFPVGGAEDEAKPGKGNEPSPRKSRERIDAASLDCWARVWSTFSRRFNATEDESDGVSRERLQEAIERAKLRAEAAVALRLECSPTATLRRVGMDILSLPVDGLSSKDQVIGEVLGRAQAYYRSLWATCSVEEKLALFDLADDPFINARPSVIRSLWEKGLIARNPALKAMNESFARYVILLGRGEGIGGMRKAAWQPWHTIRGTSVAAAIVVAFVFFLTQPQFLNLSTAFIGAVSASIPAALKMFELIRGRRAQS